jgi:hypothetical protein
MEISSGTQDDERSAGNLLLFVTLKYGKFNQLQIKLSDFSEISQPLALN